MGKTVPFYRKALKEEIYRWKSFRNALASEKEKVAFDDLMDMCGNNGMAGSAACNPIVLEPMAMYILLAQQKNIRTLEKKLTIITQLSK